MGDKLTHQEAIIEIMAALEHNRWSLWQKSLRDRGNTGDNGELVIPSDYAGQLRRMSSVTYDELTDGEKQFHRVSALEFLEAWNSTLRDLADATFQSQSAPASTHSQEHS